MAAQLSVHLDASLRDQYESLFRACSVRRDKQGQVKAAAGKVLGGKAIYEAVATASGVPWFVVGAIHLLESGCNFKRHLHNGDPLSARTVHVPKGRPLAIPPFTWEQSALDALKLTRLSDWSDWTVAGTLFKLEAFNGFGYRRQKPPIHTPYLWSFTNHYTKGKYGADGKYSPDLVSAQVGIVALFRELEAKAGESLWPPEVGLAEGIVPPPAPYPGRVIRRGEANHAIVADIQQRLLVANCGPVDEEGEFGVETEASVKLFQSRHVNRRGAPLGVDGLVGPNTWEALFGRASVTTTEPHEQTDSLVARALAIATTQIGVHEEPPFQNTGKQVSAYLKSIGLGQGFNWCAAFIYWCFHKAAEDLGIANPAVKTGGCLMHWQNAGKLGIRRIPAAQAIDDPSLLMPGQVFIMDHGGGKGHTGFVERVEGGLLVTVEGNTNPGGGRDGDGVYRRNQRALESINVGFIDYAGSTPRDPGDRPPAVTITGGVRVDPNAALASLPDVAPLVSSASSGGLLLKAVRKGIFEPPIWIDVPFHGMTLRVGAHALRARVGGRLLRLPVSYSDWIEISNALDWIPPTSAMSDVIWNASKVRIQPHGLGKWNTEAESADSSRRMRTLEWVVKMNKLIDADIPADKWGLLAATEGKDWLLSKRSLLPAKEGGAPGAQTYGWHRHPSGDPVQEAGDDRERPFHSNLHFDYSQTLRPIKRKVLLADNSEHDLLDLLERDGLPAAVLAPFRVAPGLEAPMAMPLEPESRGSKPASRGAKKGSRRQAAQ